MAMQLEHTQEALHPSLALFQRMPVSSGIESMAWVDTLPSAPLSKDSPVVFDIGPKSTEYIDPKKNTGMCQSKDCQEKWRGNPRRHTRRACQSTRSILMVKSRCYFAKQNTEFCRDTLPL